MASSVIRKWSVRRMGTCPGNCPRSWYVNKVGSVTKLCMQLRRFSSTGSPLCDLRRITVLYTDAPLLFPSSVNAQPFILCHSQKSDLLNPLLLTPRQIPDNLKDDTAPLSLSNHSSKHEDYGFRGRFAAYRNAAATHYDDETDPSPHPNAPSSPTPRTAAKLASTASPKVSNSDLTRNVHSEVDRRRNCRETFTQPLDTAPEDHDEKREIVDFLYTFTKTYPAEADEREKIIHDQYPDSVGKFYKELVLGDGTTESKISEKDFWQRFYFRCDEDRILKEAQKRDYQQRVAIGQTTRSKLLFNDAGDMVGTKEEENQTRVSSENQPAPRSILKTDRWNHKDQAALGIKQLQMIDSFDDDDDSRSYDQVPRVFEDLDDLNEASFSRIQATTSDSRGGSELTKTESENDEQLGDEALGSSIGAAAAGIRFVDDGLNKVREYQADIVAEHTDRLPEWWMQTVPYRTLE
mmetsp:Transcript_9192/g.23281  ORF Transcript_9192/g.23281 Transcript_9192/m.23281 type:complete len:464 (-) Transcript_9192:200-1591(-)